MALQIDSVLEIVNHEFLDRRSKNPRYSLRAFARRLDVSVSTLSELMNGKRPFSQIMAGKVLAKIGTKPDLAKRALATCNLKGRKRKIDDTISSNFTELGIDEFHVVSDWYYFAILSLAETQGFRSSPEWIARRLNITGFQARAAVERLERLKLLVRNPRGKLVPTGAQLHSSDDVVNLSVRNSHYQNLELARHSLDTDEISDRYFITTTMAIDPDRLPKAKKMLRTYRDRVMKYLESSKKKEVYKLCISLFPLTRGDL